MVYNIGMTTHDQLKDKILKYYTDNFRQDDENLDLSMPASDIEDPNMREFRKALKLAHQHLREHYVVETRKKDPDFIEELVEVEEHEVENEVLDFEKMQEIEEKVTTILYYLNISLYTRKLVRDMIIRDVMDSMIDTPVSAGMEEKIRDVITHLVEHEFEEYSAKKKMRRRELLTDLLGRILPDLNSAFEQHKLNKVKKMTWYQIQNYITYLLEVIDEKYIQVDKREKKLNNEEYTFLKNKIRTFISQKYDNLFIRSRLEEE
jgi:hypothetical protein